MAEKGKNPPAEKHAGKADGKKPVEAPKQQKPAASRETQIIRFVETNLSGNKNVEDAIRRIDGISFMLSNAIARKCGFRGKKLGQLSEGEMKRLEDAILNPQSIGIPEWMLNHRSEPATGKARHLTASQLEFTHKMDINELKKMKCYRGVRHIQGQPVRGQRTRSSFRKGKSVGVKRKKEAPGAGAKK
jgi:small subunit ribosomal protein S13